jgi:hypothetical protein
VSATDRHNAWFALASSSPATAVSVLDDALRNARRHRNVEDQIALRRALGVAERNRMRLTESIHHLKAGIALAEKLGNTVLAAHCRNTLAGSLAYAGRAKESLAMVDRVLTELPPSDRLQAEAQRIPILAVGGFHREALAASDLLLTQFTDDRDSVWSARVRQSRSMVNLYLGRPASLPSRS